MNATLDFQTRIDSINKILGIGEYTTAATEAVKLIEQALRRMVSQYIDQVDDKVRSDVQEAVKKRVRGDGGIDKLTMGQMIYTLRDAKFLEDWARVTNKSLSSLSVIDLEKLAQLRNKIMHDGAEATKTEAEFLLQGLKMILETFDLIKPCGMASQSDTMKPAGGNEKMGTVSVPFALQKRIIEFLLTLPTLNDSSQQQAFLNSAGLDKQLQDRIRVADPPSQFFHLLVPILLQYGTLEDGRHALQAILEAAKTYVGREGRTKCERLLRELRSAVAEHAGGDTQFKGMPFDISTIAPISVHNEPSPREEAGKTFVPGVEYDVFISFDNVDDQPRHGAKEGWVTILIRELHTELANTLGTEKFVIWTPHQLRGHIPRNTQIHQQQQRAAVFVVVVSRGFLKSEWCQQFDFLRVIHDAAPQGRVFLIERDRIAPNERPPEFGEIRGYAFWVEDRVGRPPRTIGDPTPQRDQELYYERLGDLCADLAQELQRLQRERT